MPPAGAWRASSFAGAGAAKALESRRQRAVVVSVNFMVVVVGQEWIWVAIRW